MVAKQILCWTVLVFTAVAGSLRAEAAREAKTVSAPGRQRVLVAWPTDASGRRGGNEWFAALAGHQLRLRLSAVGGLDVELLDGKDIRGGNVREAAREMGAAYIVLQSYELPADNKSVHYYAEAAAIDGELGFVPIERTFAVEQLGGWVDSCAVRFLDAIGVPMSPGLSRFFGIPAINVEFKKLKAFGEDAVAETFSSEEEGVGAARRIKAIVDSDARNLLAHYLAARAYLAVGKNAEGAGLLKDFLTVVPCHAALYTDAARAFRIAGLSQQALETAAMAEKEGIRNTALLCEGAAALAALGQWWKAARAYETVLKSDPGNAEALLYLARQGMKDGKAEAALGYARRLTEAQPKDARGHVEMGKAHMALGDFQQAVVSFEAALALEANVDILYLVGLCYDRTEEYPRALDAYRRYLTVYPKHAEALGRMVENYVKIGNWSSAAEYAYRLYELDGVKHASYLSRAAVLYDEAGSADRARRLYAECIRKGLCDREVRVRLARIEYDRKDFAAVVKALDGVESTMVREKGLASALGQSNMAVGRYAEAVPWFRELVAERPNSPEVMLHLAQAYEMSGDRDAAIHTYRQLMGVAHGDSDAEYAFRIAKIHDTGGNRDEAIRAYRENIVGYPSDMRNYERLAELLIGSDSWADARDLLIEMINFPQSDARYRKMLAEVCTRQNDRVAAVRSYQEYLEIEGEDAGAWKGLAAIHFERQLYPKAAEAYRHVVRLVEGDFEAWYRLGVSLINTADAAGAIEALSRAHRLNPADTGALLALAEAARRTDETELLVSVLGKLKVLKPQDAAVRMELGACLLAQEKPQEAVSVMEEASGIEPQNSIVHARLARVYEQLGNHNARYSHLKAGLSASPADADINYELGRFFYGRGNLSKAGEHLARAMDADAMRADIRHAYARLLFDTDLRSEALEHAAWAAERAPYMPQYYLLLARVAQEVGKPTQALEAVENALRIDSADVELLSFAGMLYWKVGRSEDAKQWLQRALSQGSRCTECYRSLGEIFLNENLYTRAAGYLRRALEEGGYDERTAMLLGNGLRKSLEDAKAREVFEDVLKNNRRQPEARYHLVHLALRSGNLKYAEELGRRFDRGEKTLWHHLAAGELHEAHGDMDAARLSYGVAVRLRPDCSEALAGFGRVAIERGEYQEAIEHTGKALVKNPYDPYLTVDLGRAYEGMGDVGSASELYKEVVKNYPEISEAYYRLAVSLSKTEKYRKAMSVINEGLARCPHSPKLYMALGREYQRAAKYEEAVKAYQEAVKRGGQAFADAYVHIAAIYADELDNDAGAQRYFKKYLKAGGSRDQVKKQMANLGM